MRKKKKLVDLSPPIWEGTVDDAYANPRDEVTALVPRGALRVLDIGCSVGIMGESLRRRGCHVTGIELVGDFARDARGRLDKVVEGDIESMAQERVDPGAPFDCVVMADVLEHLRDPWAVVRWAAGLVGSGGAMVISVPNIRHLKLLWSVIARREWPYQPVGIFDKTHLRWFAYRNLPQLIDGTGFEIVELARSRQLRTRKSRLDLVSPILGDFGTMQFIFRCERTAPPELS